jgi:hypothetical protein
MHLGLRLLQDCRIGGQIEIQVVIRDPVIRGKFRDRHPAQVELYGSSTFQVESIEFLML